MSEGPRAAGRPRLQPVPTIVPDPADPEFVAPDGSKRGSNWTTWAGGIAGLVVLGLAFWALSHIARDTSWSQIRSSIHETPTHLLVLSAMCAAASYVVLIAYDGLATAHLGYRLKLRTLAAASFCSFTMSHTLGLTVLTGGTVRYRIYTRAGVTPIDVGLIVLLCGWTFWLGIIFVAGLGLMISPHLATPFREVAPHAERWAGFLLLAGAAAYTLLAAMWRRPIRWKQVRFTLPDGRETLAQIAIGAVDLAFAALTLYVLLPTHGLPSALNFFVIYAVAMVVGALSHAPGGLGVFETVVVLMLPHSPKADVLAALVLFRLIYTLIPFMFGLTLLVIIELRAFLARRALRRADAAP
jgi:uncharacterized membrane protein YbhN (UPF0104 family)